MQLVGVRAVVDIHVAAFGANHAGLLELPKVMPDCAVASSLGDTRPARSRSLNVDDLDQAVEFYSKLFNVAPAKRKPGYANFSDKVRSEIARLSEEGLFTEEEINTTCCFATQDKVWVSGPADEKWEVYTVLSDSETFGTSPNLLADNDTQGDNQSVCCGASHSEQEGVSPSTAAACC